jgi:hypothetical protein
MNEKALPDRVLARKKREAQALKANIQRRKEQSRQLEKAIAPAQSEDSLDE